MSERQDIFRKVGVRWEHRKGPALAPSSALSFASSCKLLRDPKTNLTSVLECLATVHPFLD